MVYKLVYFEGSSVRLALWKQGTKTKEALASRLPWGSWLCVSVPSLPIGSCGRTDRVCRGHSHPNLLDFHIRSSAPNLLCLDACPQISPNTSQRPRFDQTVPSRTCRSQRVGLESKGIIRSYNYLVLVSTLEQCLRRQNVYLLAAERFARRPVA